MSGRFRAALASGVLGVVLGGCTDDSVSVLLEFPPDLDDAVASVTVRVLEPAETDPFDCDDVAFSERNRAALLARTTQRVSWTRPDRGAPLAAMRREGTKLYWAEGLDHEQQVLVAGCVLSSETIDSSVDIALRTEPTKRLEAPSSFDLFGDLSGPMPSEIDLTVTDLRAEPLPNAEVRWRVVAAGQDPKLQTERSDAEGRLRIHPSVPTLAGPYLLDIRTRWQVDRSSPLYGMTPPRTLLGADAPNKLSGISGFPIEHVVGRFMEDGTVGFAILTVADPGEQVTAFDATLWVGYQTQGTPAFALTPLRLGQLYTTIAGRPVSNGLRLFWIAQRAGDFKPQWYELEDRPGSPPAVSALPIRGIDLPNPKAFGYGLPVGRCTRQPPDERVMFTLVYRAADGQTLVGERQVFDPQGPATSPFSVLPLETRLCSDGCVERDGGDPLRVLFACDRTLTLHVDRGDRLAQLETANVSAVVGLTHAPDADHELFAAPRLTQDRLAVALFRLRNAPSGDGLALEVVEGALAPLPFSGMTSGDLDNDGERDYVFVYGTQSPRLWYSLGQPFEGTRLAAAGQVRALMSPQVAMADFDGDGFDDLYVGNVWGPANQVNTTSFGGEEAVAYALILGMGPSDVR